MRVEVINTGTELLLGNVVNSHLAYFGQRLFPLGLRIERQTTIPDGEAITHALKESFGRCEIVLVTGGLGPTTDDITREVVAEFLGLELEESAEVMEAIRARLERRKIPFRERMKRQAMVPRGSTVLPNLNGTAPGLYVPSQTLSWGQSPHLFLLPGPPRELKPIFEDFALPIFRSLCGEIPDRQCRIYHVVGMGESTVEELVGLELSQRGDLEVGYCARPNEVDLRLIGATGVLDEVESRVLSVLGKHLVSRKGELIEEVVVNRLRQLCKKVAVAESCTGGLLSHRITNVSGASEIFPQGFITYANEAKTNSLGVPSELIAELGAVSEPVARAMAEGAMRNGNADYGIGITGIAGPTGGTADKPVGTVFIGFARRDGTSEVRRELFPTDRETFKQLTTQAALDWLRREIF